MKSSLPIAKINGNVVHGQAHIQPGINKWIGVCNINRDVLEYDSDNLGSIIIDYEGPFNCRSFHTKGRGKAKVLAISDAAQSDQITITFEGVEEPELQKELKKDLCHSYNENLPVYINNNQRLETVK